MFDRLDDLLIRYEELMEELGSPEVASDTDRIPQADEGAVRSGSDCGGV